MGLPAAPPPPTPGSADSSPGNVFTPTPSHQERERAGPVGGAGLIQTMNLLNTVLCSHGCSAGDLLAGAEPGSGSPPAPGYDAS